MSWQKFCEVVFVAERQIYQEDAEIEQQNERHSSELVSIEHGSCVVETAIAVRGAVRGGQGPLVRPYRGHRQCSASRN